MILTYRNIEDRKWYWMDDNGQFNPFESALSHRFDVLNIGQSMTHHTIRGKYELTKLSTNKGQQRNTNSNEIREIRKMSLIEMQNYNRNQGLAKQDNKMDKADEKELKYVCI